MCKDRECKVQSEIQIICPHCAKMIELPMCKAVNGKEIICLYCEKKFKFRL
jgi:uncharacterized Zn-finger protein